MGKPKTKAKYPPCTFHTSKTFMDYLHGDVSDGEAEWACIYEYARESRLLWKLSTERDRLQKKAKLSHSQAAIEILQQNARLWPAEVPWALPCLECGSFPKRDWMELSPSERSAIPKHFQTRKVPPLPMVTIQDFKAYGWLAKVADMAAHTAPTKDAPTGDPAPPFEPVPLFFHMNNSLKSPSPVYLAMFGIDFSKGETQLVEEFRQWLQIEKNVDRLAQHRKTNVIVSASLDRLKDVAAWRLYRELGNNIGAANAFADSNRKSFTPASALPNCTRVLEKCRQEDGYKPGDPRPFRRAEAQDEKPRNQADLFGEESDCSEAKGCAIQFLSRIMPGRFTDDAREFAEEFPIALLKSGDF